MRNVNAAALFLAIGICSGCSGTKIPPPVTTAKPANAMSARAGDTIVIGDKVQSACSLPRMEERPAFDFDSSVVSEREKPVLTALAQCLTTGALRGKRLSLVGRADPRGETEYNMSLGSSRAESVAAYLRKLGVATTQLGVTSRGELDAKGHDEASWAEDRRVDVALSPHS